MTILNNTRLPIEVGKKYLSRNNTVFNIFRELVEGDVGYDRGFRFRGISIPLNPDADFVHTYTCSFKSDGTQFSDSGVIKSTPFDLMKEIGDMDDALWIEHEGGAVPNLPSKLETRWSDGDQITYPLDKGVCPNDLAWTRAKGDGLRIVAYRILE